MDILNNFCEKANSMLDVIDIDVEEEQKVNILVCVYIISFLVFKPNKATEIAKMPVIQLSIIALTLHISRTNYVTASLIAIAFIITLITNTEAHHHSCSGKDCHLDIEDREKFSGSSPDDDSDDEEAKDDDEDDEDDDDDDDDDDEEIDDFSDDSEEDEEDDDEEDSDDEDKKDDINAKPIKKSKHKKSDKKLKANKKRLQKIKESFKGGLIPKNSINDTFKDLHMAIHKLEHFINTED